MSSDADAAAIVAQYDTIYTQEYLIVAATVIVICDAFITFDREVACFWTAKRTGASLLFFANRWMTLTLCIMNMVVWASFPSDQMYLGRNGGAGDWISAICSRSRFHMAIISQDTLSRRLDASIRTTQLSHLSLVVIVSRTPLIVADILLIYVTCTKLSSRDTLRGIGQSRRMTMSDILLRSGVIYFVTLFGLNVLHLVLSATAIATDNAGSSYVTGFTAPITSILISHFLLELQEANQMVVRLDPDDPLHSSRNPYDNTPSFISSLGGFVNPNLSARSDDDDSFELPVSSRSEAPGEKEDEGPEAETSEVAPALPFWSIA